LEGEIVVITSLRIFFDSLIKWLAKWLAIFALFLIMSSALFFLVIRLIIYFIPQLLFALSPQPSDHEYLIPLCF
jgi:hypothetical protein